MPFIKITVKVPKEIVRIEAVRQAIKDAQEFKTVPKLRKLFGQTVEGWNHRPIWTRRRVDTANVIGVFVYPTGDGAEQWKIVNAGARPHVIRARRRKLLRFQPGYRASTRPRVLSSRAKGRFGPFVMRAAVKHPGFEAREFVQTIADEHESEFARDMQEAIDNSAPARP